MTNDTYWKIRAYATLVELAHARLREATQAYHQLLEQNGISTDTPLQFDDVRHSIQEPVHAVPRSDC